MSSDQPVPPVAWWRRAAVPAVWSVVLAGVAWRGRDVEVGTWIIWAAALAALAAHVLAARVILAGVPAALRHRLPSLLALAGAPLFVLAALSGGSASPAALAAGPIVLGLGWRLGMRRALAAAGATVALLALADLVVSGAPVVPRLIASGLATLAIGVAPLWHSRRLAESSVEARRRLARVEGYLADRRLTPHGSRAIGADLRREAQVVQEDAEGLTHLVELDRFLRDVRDALGADEAILWRWSEARSTQIPISWSTEDADTPQHFRYEEWAPQVKWSAETGTTHVVGAANRARFIAAPVERRGRLHGVLSVSAAEGIELPADAAKSWVERHARHAALLNELFEIRREYVNVSRQMVALHSASLRIRATLPLAELGRTICEAALEITSGTRAALARWDPASGTGRIEAISASHALRDAFEITPEALVAAQCRRGEALLRTDLRQYARRHTIYGAGEPKRDLGSIAIAPLRLERETVLGGERDTFGALIVEAEEPEELTPGELRNLSLLGSIAATALEVSWEVQEVSRRASTDPLTGLGNRRSFDEELGRLLEGSDRFGHSTGLIVADIDHFKRINDTWGHDAGDAVLRHVARVFLEVVRAMDVCARYGGEEMVVLLPQTDLSGSVELAERLRRTLASRPAEFRGERIEVTCSVGVAAYPECTSRRDGLFGAADRALYEAKQAGRNRVKSAAQVHVTQ